MGLDINQLYLNMNFFWGKNNGICKKEHIEMFIKVKG